MNTEKLRRVRQDLPEDQCIFVRGYRVARTLKIFPRLKGAAGDSPDPSGDDCEPELEVVSLPIFTQVNSFFLNF